MKLDCECERLPHSHLRVGNLVVGVLGQNEGVATSSLLLLLGINIQLILSSRDSGFNGVEKHCKAACLMSMYLVGGDLVRAFRGVLHRLFPVSSQVQLITYL